MSWLISVQDVPSDSVKADKKIDDEIERLLASKDVNGQPNSGLDSAETRDQIDAAISAALGLIDSGALGDDAKNTYNIGLSGHANPNHTPEPGVINDTIHVTVSRSSNA